MATTTSNFGAGRREGHDASTFYERFEAPELSDDDVVHGPFELDDPFICGDACAMKELPDASVALVVTSPPYFAGKMYEEELGKDGVPASYLEYLELLHDVFAECKRVLEPGGRIAVNVANLGRKPYRSLSADVLRILQDRLRLLPRGEIIWRKSQGSSGNCAWGSFRSPTNPSLRDLTERVIVASKGRFNRAVDVRTREKRNLPHETTLTTEEFMSATLDVWDLAPESARRVNHPAPFPVELPQRVIELYTWRDDLVLDPFMGSGSALVAAARTGRRYVGYDLDPQYVEISRRRVAIEGSAAVVADTRAAHVRAAEALGAAGFRISGTDVRQRATGIVVDIVAEDRGGAAWYVLVTGAATISPSGLDVVAETWQLIGKASALAANQSGRVLIVATSGPRPGKAPAAALKAVVPAIVHDVIALDSPADLERLALLVDAPAPEPRCS